ncbi:DUF1801 domain-containing protein [Sphingomonas sp. UYP23]
MVKSSALTVDQYFADLDPNRLEAMCRLREECRSRLKGWEERMQWGMPGYGPAQSDALISFDDKNGYLSVFIPKSTISCHRKFVKGASFGMGCIRYPRPDLIDFDVLGAMLSSSFRAKGGIA